MTNIEKNYVGLHNHSHYSLLDGFATIDEYMKAAKEQGMIGIGLADHGTGSGLYEFINKARANDLIPVPGLEFYVAPENPLGAKVQQSVFYGPNGRRAPKYDVGGNGAHLHLTVFAYNNKGLSNLFKLTSLSWQPENFYYKPRIDTNMLAEHSEGLIVTTGCPSSEINRRFLLKQDKKAYEYAERLKDIFGDNFYVEIMNHEMDDELERILIPKLIKLGKDLNLPFLGTNDSHYAFKENADAHERLLAVQSASYMSEPGFNEGGTRFNFSGPEYHLKSYDEMYAVLPPEIAEEALANTIKIAKQCDDITLDYDPHLRPVIDLPEGHTNVSYLKKLILEGFIKKRGHEPAKVQKESQRRINEEFKVLHSNDFIDYFLVVHDYIDFAHRSGISIGAGRGCFLPGSKVRSTKGVYRNIENIKPGEKVQTHDTTYQVVEDTFIYDVENEDMLEITLSNGKTINATADHLIFHKDKGFIKAEDFIVGDIMLGAKGRREQFDYNCDSCGEMLKTDKQTWDERTAKGYYKPKGEYWCYDCVKSNLHSIPEVAEGSLKGSLRSKEPEVKAKIAKSVKEHWAENYEERMERWHEYMDSLEYQEYRKKRQLESIEKYSDPELLEELTRQGRSGYKTGHFVSYQQNEKEIYFASSYELKALTILETDSDVSSFDRCSTRVPYIKPSTGLIHNYLPDLEVHHKDGSVTVIEVKAKWQLKEEDTFAKLEQAKEFFEERGFNFEIWTEDTFKELNDEWHNDVEVLSIREYKYTGKVYDLQVANVHNYTLEGVTVHNSVGGSEIAYVLDISDTDPIRYDLLFERFLSPGRGALYEIDYLDGDTEEISVSEQKIKLINTPKGPSKVKVYIHELDNGDTVLDNDEKTPKTIQKIFVKRPGSAPDVDTDFHTQGREKVIEYVTQKYGKENVANIITFGKFKAKSSFKQMCTIYEIPYAVANSISATIPDSIENTDITIKDLLNPNSPRYNEGEDFRNATSGPEWKELLEMSIAIDDRIRSTGVHPCGVIISNQKLAGVIPTQVRQSDGITLTQWEYPQLESMGLIKMDFLGLENIDIVDATIENIKSVGKEAPDMRELTQGEMDDEKVYEMLGNGDTVGIFQMASPGVRELLRKARPTKFMDIATITALYRPGPMSTGSHNIWAERLNGRAEVEPIHPELAGTQVERILDETAGVVVFQEQLMKIATDFAGMTPYESELLRKAMGKKNMTIMMEMQPKFIDGSIENGGVSEEAAETLWDTLVGFAEYGFNKSHSVSYAINAYKNMYLKANYPAEYMAAVIQQKSRDANTVAQFIQDAINMGLTVGPVDINKSQMFVAPTRKGESEYDIVYGLAAVKHINLSVAYEIVKERESGEYTSVADFAKRISKRVKMSSTALANLALSGAFDQFGVSRKLVVENARDLLVSGTKSVQKGMNLFDLVGSTQGDVVSAIVIEGPDYSFNEKIKLEADRVGLFLSGHPTSNLGIVKNSLNARPLSDALNGSHNAETDVLATFTTIQGKVNRQGKRSIGVVIDDGRDSTAFYLPKFIVDQTEKAFELNRIEKASEKGEEVKETKRSIAIQGALMDSSIPALDLEPNDVYLVKLKTRIFGEDTKITPMEITKLETMEDGSLPFVIQVEDTVMKNKVEKLIENHKGETFIKAFNSETNSDEVLSGKVKLTRELIMEIENIVGYENVITKGV